MLKRSAIFLTFLFAVQSVLSQDKIEFWLTKSDQTVLLQKQNKVLFGTGNKSLPTIEINETKTFQTIDGFGYTLTGGSAFVIDQLDEPIKARLLQELFGRNRDSISISYLRISIGASDLNFAPFTYNDLLFGETDLNLTRFSLSVDEKYLIPLLQKILRINPKIKILGSPWSAPVWMKDKSSFRGGHLQPQYYAVYAQYLVKYIREMEKRGIRLDAVTVQNEPLHDGNNPSMLMFPQEQANFVKNYLGRAFQSANIRTKIIVYDHNCDKPEYPLEVLSDAEVKRYIDGTAFHLYAGNIGCLSVVHDAHPDKNVYFTEQYTSSKGSFREDFNWHTRNLIIGAMRNWSKNVLEWNLASDAEFKPHTAGGCNVCKGALTIDKNRIQRNVSYYIIAQAAKFVSAGSIRIDSGIVGNINNVAFRTPNGEIVLIVHNEGPTEVHFNIKFKNKMARTALPAESAGTFVWK